MPRNRAFDNQVVSTVAGVSKAVYAPRDCRGVTIFSTASTDAFFYSEQDNDLTAIPISAGWNQPIILNSGGGFTYQDIAFWLKCSVDATFYLLWA